MRDADRLCGSSLLELRSYYLLIKDTHIITCFRISFATNSRLRVLPKAVPNPHEGLAEPLGEGHLREPSLLQRNAGSNPGEGYHDHEKVNQIEGVRV